MEPKYNIGQKVKISPNDNESQSPRDSDIHPYAGRLGQVTNYYWISPREEVVFFIYTVRVEEPFREITLYEDELEPCFA
jgi:hypothetical protein